MKVNKKFTLMPFTSPLQEDILNIMALGAIEAGDLLAALSKRHLVTKQGMYKALRILLRDELIIKERTFYVINKTWFSRLEDFVNKGRSTLGISLPFSKGIAKSRTVVPFKDIEALNIYWGHLLFALADAYPGKPFFFYNHHQWSYHYDQERELYLYEKSLTNKYKVMITLGSGTNPARSLKKKFGNSDIQIAIDETISVPKTDALCLIGNYFIATRYDKKTMDEIDTLFKSTVSFGEEERNRLRLILASSQNPKMIIVKDAQKAMIWKKRLAKNFVLLKTEL